MIIETLDTLCTAAAFDEFNDKYEAYFEEHVADEEDEADVSALTLATENAGGRAE